MEAVDLVLERLEPKQTLLIVDAVLAAFQQPAVQDAKSQAKHIVAKDVEVLLLLSEDVLEQFG